MPSLGTAVEHVVDASHRVLLDRLNLLRIEAKEDVATVARAVGLSIGGAVMMLYGWIAVIAWVAYLLWGSVPLGVALGVLAVLHLGGGAALAWYGARMLAAIRPLRPDDAATDQRERQALSAGATGAL